MGSKRKEHMTILDNMTFDVADTWKRIVNNAPHPPPCACEACLYSLYRKRLTKGRPYGRLTFFANWLIHRARVEYLVEHHKFERTFTSSGPAWRVKISDYDNAPVSKARKYIDQLNEDESIEDITRDLERIHFYVMKSRVEGTSFLKLLDGLAQERYEEWLQTRQDLRVVWEKNLEDLALLQKIVDFVRSSPERTATKRDLERRFQGKHVADLDCALSIAWFFPALRQRKKGKSTIFYWKRPMAGEIRAYNQRVSESIIAARNPFSSS